MKKIIIIVLLVLVLVAFLSADLKNFKLIEQWDHKEEIFGRASHPLVKDGHIISFFYMIGGRNISKQKVIKFANRGQGPAELTNMFAMFKYKEDIAIVENPEKIKILSKKKDIYVLKETKWMKRSRYLHSISQGAFYKNKFFLTGIEILSWERTKDSEASFLKVYSDDGKMLKRLFKKKITAEVMQRDRFFERTYHIVGSKTKLIFMRENELKLHIIDPDKLIIKKNVVLETPKFYKKMPEDFYTFKKKNKFAASNLMKDIEKWKTGYSRINKVVINEKYIVLQIRTCSDDLKKFALLIYDQDNYKLLKTIFINDLFLGEENGKYYCYANGDPGYDEEASGCKINIYKFEN